jgi:hypothetical protein
MLVQLFSPHAPRVLARPWLHPVHPQPSENVICDKMVFSEDQSVFILEHYFSTRSYAECHNAFRNSFPDSVVANKSTIQLLVERFCETGSVGEKRRSGRPSVLSNDSLEDIRTRLLQSPRKIINKTFPTNFNNLWIRTKGYTTSQTASIPRSSLPWTYRNWEREKDALLPMVPPRSPDLTPTDYFLWGYLKQLVYSNCPQTIEDLKQNIEVAISSVSQIYLKKVVRNMGTRLNTCYAENGGHFQHLL